MSLEKRYRVVEGEFLHLDGCDWEDVWVCTCGLLHDLAHGREPMPLEHGSQWGVHSRVIGAIRRLYAARRAP